MFVYIFTFVIYISILQPGVAAVAPCPPNAIMDLLFIVDSSSSIGDANFDLVRDFISNVVGTFNVGNDSARVRRIFDLYDT